MPVYEMIQMIENPPVVQLAAAVAAPAEFEQPRVASAKKPAALEFLYPLITFISRVRQAFRGLHARAL